MGSSLSLILTILVRFPLKCTFNAIRATVLARKRELPISRYIFISLIRSFLTTFSPRQIQFLFPNGTKTVLNWHKGQQSPATPQGISLQLHSVPLPVSGGTLHCIRGNPPGVSGLPKAMLFLHGGGYAVPLSDAHLDWCYQHLQSAWRACIDLRVAVLEYSLTPGSPYPTQLCQAAEALDDLLQRGLRPSDIVIGGDSAGGNLTFALLSHLLHPHPNVKRVHVNEPLAGAFGISPWITMDMSTESFQRNCQIDMLSPSLVQQSGNDYLAGTTAICELERGEGWTLAFGARADWWSGLPNVVRRLYLNTGYHEMFHDHIVAFTELLKKDHGNNLELTLDVGREESHDHILTDFMLGNHNGRAFRSLMQWTEKAFKLGSLGDMAWNLEE